MTVAVIERLRVSRSGNSSVPGRWLRLLHDRSDCVCKLGAVHHRGARGGGPRGHPAAILWPLRRLDGTGAGTLNPGG